MRTSLFILTLIVAGAASLLAQGGTPIKVTTTLHPDGTKTVMQTDPDNKTAEATTTTGTDKLIQKIVYKLDEQNQPESGIVYDAKGRAAFKSVYKRDGAGRVAEQFDYTPDDKLLRHLVFEFGANNRVSKVRAYDGNGVEIPSASSKTNSSRRR